MNLLEKWLYHYDPISEFCSGLQMQQSVVAIQVRANRLHSVYVEAGWRRLDYVCKY